MVDVRISCKAEQLLLCSISLTFTLAVKDKKWRGKRDSINILHVTFIKRYLQYSCKSKKSLRMNHLCPWGWQHRQRNSAEHLKVGSWQAVAVGAAFVRPGWYEPAGIFLIIMWNISSLSDDVNKRSWIQHFTFHVNSIKYVTSRRHWLSLYDHPHIHNIITSIFFGCTEPSHYCGTLSGLVWTHSYSESFFKRI